MNDILLVIFIVITIIYNIEYKKLEKENKQLKVFAVYNDCAVFTGTGFEGIKFKHEEP